MCDLRRALGRRSLMAIKLDMEQAYDRTSWHFLQWTLRDLGFGERWIGWVMDYVEFLSFFILVNGSPMEFFHSSVGLCQGCPLTSYLFIYVLMLCLGC